MSLTVENPLRKNETITMPDGSVAHFDHEGISRDAGESCGIHLIPGYVVLEGTPEVIITADKQVKKPNGPLVVCINPSMAGQKGITAPNGYGPVDFDAHGQARVPDNCGLDQIPGYAYVNDKGEPVEGHYEAGPAEPCATRTQPAPPRSLDEQLEREWRSQQEATKPTTPVRQGEIDMPLPKSEVQRQQEAQAAAKAQAEKPKDEAKEEPGKGHADHGKGGQKHGHAIQEPVQRKGSRPVPSAPGPQASRPAPAQGVDPNASLYEAAEVAQEAEE